MEESLDVLGDGDGQHAQLASEGVVGAHLSLAHHVLFGGDDAAHTHTSITSNAVIQRNIISSFSLYMLGLEAQAAGQQLHAEGHERSAQTDAAGAPSLLRRVRIAGLRHLRPELGVWWEDGAS